MTKSQKVEPATENTRYTTWLVIWLIILGIGAILYLSYPALRLRYTYQINYNEGWNVYHDREAILGQPLYANPAYDPFTPVNYPPLSFYIVGLAGLIFNNYLMAGRVISFVSMLFVSIMSAIILKRVIKKWVPALLGGLTIVVLFSAYAQEYVGMDDPQMLAHAITMAGALVYLWRGKTIPGLAATAILLIIGLFTKHNLLPLTFAISLDILLQSRNRFLMWAGFMTLAFTAIDAIFAFQSGGFFLDQVLIGRGYNTTRIIGQFNKLDVPFLILTLIAALTALSLIFNKNFRLFPFYLFVSGIVGFYFSGGSGTNINMIFDLFIAIGLLTGIAFASVEPGFPLPESLRRVGIILLPPIVVCTLLFRLPDKLPHPDTQQRLQAYEDNFLQDTAYLKSIPGRAYCENMLLCFMADKQLEIDPFMASEMAITGNLDEGLILRMFETRQFSIVQLKLELTEDQLNGEEYANTRRSGSGSLNMKIAIGNNYDFDRKVSSGVFYRVKN